MLSSLGVELLRRFAVYYVITALPHYHIIDYQLYILA